MFLEKGGATWFKVQTKPTVSDRNLPKKNWKKGDSLWKILFTFADHSVVDGRQCYRL